MRETIARKAAVGTGGVVLAAVVLFAALQQREVAVAASTGVSSAPVTTSPQEVIAVFPVDSALPVVTPVVPAPGTPGGQVADSGPPRDSVPAPLRAGTPEPTPQPAASPPVDTVPPVATQTQVPTDSLVARGRTVYTEQRCSACHSIAGEGSPRSPLDGVGARLNAAQIRLWIVDPQAARPGIRKPDFADLPAGEIDALVAYMQTLR